MKLSAFRIIPQFDRYEWLVNFAQTLPGKAVLLFIFAFEILVFHRQEWWLDMTVILAAISVFPQHRRILTMAGTFYWLTQYTRFNWELISQVIEQQQVTNLINLPLLQPSVIIATLLFCIIFLFLAIRYQNSFPMRRPVATLLYFYLFIILVVCYMPMDPLYRTYLWAFIIILGRYIWFLGYSLLDRKAVSQEGQIWQLRFYLPFWVGLTASNTPLPKGSSYLRRIEAKTPTDLAVCQLKGIKLILWAFVLTIFETLFMNIFHGQPGMLKNFLHIPFGFNLPTFDQTFYAAVEGTPFPWYESWLSLLAAFFHNVLYIAIWGHVFVGCCRMAGYAALRNTYKPLAAKTLAEFWNRYYYYFKELLVEFFFYPTYTRYFKRHPRFRLFFATLMAAGAGNVLIHFFRDIHYVVHMGFVEAVISIHVYLFYGLVLGSAIGISQLRNRKPREPRPWWRENIVAPAGVYLFYCFVLIFNDPDRNLTIKDNFVFILSLFGIQ